ncbi:hypothetical protein MNBD_GAMMA06-2060 [hydrothermal vent metagenome]|uniref:Uncharacterized protein n=1 Tax=hydrothermal vent metagenome TaxID=652676 RepID=A0A3B0W9A9_9ZZZZ
MKLILHLLTDKRKKRKRVRLKFTPTGNIAKSISQSAFLLLILLSLHTGFMMKLESLSFGDSLWLTLTTATTVGYGDISASTTWGRIATIVLIYIGGIYVFSKVIGDYFDYRVDVRDKKTKGHWKWKMNNHIVILNTPTNSGERYLQRLIKQFRRSSHYEDTPIYILTRDFPNGLPNCLIDLQNVVHYTGDPSDPKLLAVVGAHNACDIIVLSGNEHDEAADGHTFDILHRLKELNTHANVLAECVVDSNRERLQKAGANIVIRPIRAYPEMIVRAFATPGSELIIENMFNSDDDEYRRYDVEIKNTAWSEVVTRLISNDAGIAVAYIDLNTQKMVYNPAANSVPDICALITICKEDNAFSHHDVKALGF